MTIEKVGNVELRTVGTSSECYGFRPETSILLRVKIPNLDVNDVKEKHRIYDAWRMFRNFPTDYSKIYPLIKETKKLMNLFRFDDFNFVTSSRNEIYAEFEFRNIQFLETVKKQLLNIWKNY